MNYTIPAHRRGDTWDGIQTLSISVNGVPVDLTGATIRMQFKDSPDSPAVITFSTADGTIIITDALNGTIQIPERKIEVSPGRYKFDLQVDFPNGRTKTYLEGKWEIYADITD